MPPSDEVEKVTWQPPVRQVAGMSRNEARSISRTSHRGKFHKVMRLVGMAWAAAMVALTMMIGLLMAVLLLLAIAYGLVRLLSQLGS